MTLYILILISSVMFGDVAPETIVVLDGARTIEGCERIGKAWEESHVPRINIKRSYLCLQSTRDR